MLNAWIEQPAATAALFFIPRTCAAAWQGLSRFVTRIDAVAPGPGMSLLPIPIEVLYLAPHTPVLNSSSRMDFPSSSRYSKWHQEQAAQMRRVSPVSVV